MTVEFPGCTHPEVAILIIATRDGGRFERCLAALASALQGPPAEVVILLNDADPDVVAVARNAHGARVVELDVDLGTAGAWNYGAETTSARRLATLHEDARPDPGWLATLSAVMDDDPRIAVAGATLHDPDGSLQNRGWITWSDGRSWPIREATVGAIPDVRLLAVDLVSSATALVDRAHWEAVGGYDERFFPAVGVDVDLGWSAWAHGRSVVSVADATSTHDTGAMVRKGAGAAASEAQRRFLIERSERLIAEKWAAILDHGPEPQADGHRRAAAALRETAERRVRGALDGDRPPASDRWLTTGPGGGLAGRELLRTRASERRRSILDDVAAWAIERHDDLVRSLAAARERADAAEADVRRLGEERAALEADNALLRAHADRVSAELSASTLTLEDAYRELARVGREAEERAEIVERLRREVDVVVGHARHVEGELASVRATRAWRLPDAVAHRLRRRRRSGGP